MTTTRNICGYRDGVDAHRAAGEPLCADCRASDARRRSARAAKRSRATPEHDWEDIASIDLATTFDTAQERSWDDR